MSEDKVIVVRSIVSFIRRTGGILYVLALLILAPALSDYLVLNLLLFVAMFLFGYLSQPVPGVNFGMQVALFAIVGTIGP